MQPPNAFAIILLLGLSAGAWASGIRNTDVSQSLAADFPVLAEEQLPITLHYIGSTTDSHVFMTVKTSLANGRPFDHLFTYRYPKAKLELINGWSLPIQTVHMRPSNCPRLTIKPPPQRLTLLPNPQLQGRCLPPSVGYTNGTN